MAADKQLRLHAYRALFESAISYQQLHEIREALNHDLLLGESRFKEQIETMTKRRLTPGKAGRPRVREMAGRYFLY